MRSGTRLLALSAVLFAGCERTSSPSAQPQAKVAPANRIEFVHPTTPDELAKVLTAAFDAGDKESLSQLMLWGDATEDQKRQSAARLFFVDGADGERRVLETKVLPPDHDEVSKVSDSSGKFALPLKEVLNVKHGTETSQTTMSFRIGDRDGKYYLAPGY